MTKWEQFAKEKNIKNTKKSRFVRDEATGEELPSWGYKSKQNDKMADWLIEIPDADKDNHTDPRLVKREEKKARVAKNAKKQVANIDRANPSVSGGDREVRKRVLESSLKISKTSTASLGRFDAGLKGDAKLKRGEKRKVCLCWGFNFFSLTRIRPLMETEKRRVRSWIVC
jgi:regulator of ribosome biosynthesis